jgi:hypothetical protein
MAKVSPTILIGEWRCLKLPANIVLDEIKSVVEQETIIEAEAADRLARLILVRLFDRNIRSDLRWLLDTQTRQAED